MKTKEQILEWLDKQPWKNEFYEEFFKHGTGRVYYNGDLIICAFDYEDTQQGKEVWSRRSVEYTKWYNSNDRPMSWKEYCEHNPITDKDCCISSNCEIKHYTAERKRCPDYDVNSMSKELCEAFIAYMKLIQLRNAWMRNYGEVCCFCKIITKDNDIIIERGEYSTNGLSFNYTEVAKEFVSAFRDLLEIAKPLL